MAGNSRYSRLRDLSYPRYLVGVNGFSTLRESAATSKVGSTEMSLYVDYVVALLRIVGTPSPEPSSPNGIGARRTSHRVAGAGMAAAYAQAELDALVSTVRTRI